MQAAFGCCILLLSTCAQDGLDTVQLALVVYFLPSTSTNTPLVLMVVIATCAGGVFPQSTSAFTNAHIATCTVWWWWCLYFYVVVVVYMW